MRPPLGGDRRWLRGREAGRRGSTREQLKRHASWSWPTAVLPEPGSVCVSDARASISKRKHCRLPPQRRQRVSASVRCKPARDECTDASPGSQIRIANDLLPHDRTLLAEIGGRQL